MMKWFLLCSLVGTAFSQLYNDVALIVGGFNSDKELISSVEIFGCDSDRPVVVDDDLPLATYLTAGVYASEGDSVLVCGGFVCDSTDSCDVQDRCYKWNPRRGWLPSEPLLFPRSDHILVRGPNLDQPEKIDVMPIAIGYNSNAEIFDTTQQHWVPYRQMQEVPRASFCLAQGGNEVFFSDSGKELFSLDLITWDVTKLSNIPLNNDIAQGGRCAVVNINGAKGKTKGK